MSAVVEARVDALVVSMRVAGSLVELLGARNVRRVNSDQGVVEVFLVDGSAAPRVAAELGLSTVTDASFLGGFTLYSGLWGDVEVVLFGALRAVRSWP